MALTTTRHRARIFDRFVRGTAMIVINAIAMAVWFPPQLRPAVLRAFGHEVGRSAHIFSGSMVKCERLEIGDDCCINHGCHFDRGTVLIGSGVFLSVGVSLMTGHHAMGGQPARAGAVTQRPVVIGDGSWLGAHVVVLPGVRIAPGCIIGAGAVVTRDTEADGVYVGTPARRIRDLSDAPLVGLPRRADLLGGRPAVPTSHRAGRSGSGVTRGEQA